MPQDPTSPTVAGAVPGERTFFGQPLGLSTLFFTEMWERFSIYGIYTAMVYLTALPGGWIADRFIGQRRSVLYGGILIACGHLSLTFHSLPTFYLGLFRIVVGTGLLKPNISTMVGSLYTQDDPRRDAGFSIFYMGINIGAFLAPLVCGFL